MEKVTIGLEAHSYDILIEEGLFQRLSRYMTGEGGLILTDDQVVQHYGQQLKELLDRPGWHCYIMRPGEESKTFEETGRILNYMLERHLSRNAKVLAFGGGVVGDVAGFCASVYMRGIGYIQLPTTLLAQVDSSVGGKTAVNMPTGKNLVGSFYQPELVLVDPAFLKTLPQKHVVSGIGEIVKYGLILDSNFLTELEDGLPELLELHPRRLEQVIGQCCRMKATVTMADERELGLRKILNFGHTVAHGLEAATRYQTYAHGEAVLIGMGMEAALGWLARQIDETYLNRIFSLLGRIPFTRTALPETAKLVEPMELDKKNRKGKISIMLPVGTGEVREAFYSTAELAPLLEKAKEVFINGMDQ